MLIPILFVFAGLFIAYAVIVAYFYFFQSKLILNPQKLELSHKFRFDHPFLELNLFPKKKVRLNCLHFKVEDPKGVVFYLHGKSRNMDDWAKYYKDFVSKGFDFFVFDYRQFGKSEGPLSEKALHKDAVFVYEYLAQQYDPSEIVIYGRSLGSGLAAKLAQKINAKNLILETPYYSMTRMVKRIAWYLPVDYLLKYHISTYKYLKKRMYTTYIFHGMADEFIPFRQALMLQKLSKKIQLIAIQKGMHDDLSSFEEYHNQLSNILNWFVKGYKDV